MVAWRRARRGLQLAGHLAFGGLICVGWLAPLAAIGARGERRQRQRWLRWWMRRLLHIVGIAVCEHGAVQPAPALLVANHVSWLDIPCLLACTNAVFVAKADVARWPVIGSLAARVGTLFLERGHGAEATALRMETMLQRGENVAIFPEGTSTDGRGVRTFHARLFQAAKAADVPVQPVAIRYPHATGTHPAAPFIGDDSLVPHLWRLLAEERIDCELTFGQPIAADGLDRRALANRAQEQVARALAAHPDATVVTGTSSTYQAPVMPAGEHAGPDVPETQAWKTSTNPARPAPGASSLTASIPR